MNASKKILLVDDDENLVEAMRATLLSKDYNVIVAYNGEDGVTMARQEVPDLIILDIMMGKKHGYAACAELKKDPVCAGIPVIILSGVGEHLNEPEWTHAQGRTLLAEDFVEKPVKPAELLKLVEQMI
jgi:two-component system alkaline phosphatase synthesis response regulator PhoP